MTMSVVAANKISMDGLFKFLGGKNISLYRLLFISYGSPRICDVCLMFPSAPIGSFNLLLTGSVGKKLGLVQSECESRTFFGAGLPFPNVFYELLSRGVHEINTV